MNINGCVYFVLLLPCLLACDMMPTIIAEMDEIEEKCELINDPALYQKNKADLSTEEIIHYRLFLEPQKRHYVSACGLHVSPKVGRFLEAKGSETNSVERDAYIAINKGQPSLEFYLLCDVGGLNPAGNDIGWPRKMIISREDH